MGLSKSHLLDPKTYSLWPNLHTVDISLVSSCAHAGFLDWANQAPQKRRLKALSRQQARTESLPPSPRYIRRLFMWGGIGANAAVSIAWARAADEAASFWFASSSSLLGHMVRHFTLSPGGRCQGRWWTTLTSGFSHFEPAHLVANMCDFYTWASRC
ncbi:hypothetical protein diail_4803 [Diaporthe ilicicola]|nr:hypothetical protein diail_4803 [Diaporthe ilicicola]